MKHQKGFTLIELLAVILILGIIALIAIPTVSNIIKESKKGAFETTVNNVVRAVENKCSMQILNGEPLTTLYTFTSGAISPTLSVKGNLPETGTITVDSNCKTTVNVNDGTFSVLKAATENSVTTENGIVANATYAKGNVVYFNPVTGLECDLAAYNANTGASNNGTKTGCMKWYVYSGLNNTDLSVNMILDHNTTAQVAWNSTGSNTGGMKEVSTALTLDTSTWNSALNARLITANEVAAITVFAGWITNPTWYYFTNNTTTQLATCTIPTFTGCTYKWLYDRTATDATTYGALNNASSLTYGYWTSTAVASISTNAWHVYRNGSLGGIAVSNTGYGVRPVITVSKSVISSEPVYDTTDPVITGATDTTLYTTDTTFDIMTGVSVTDDSGEIITINTTSNLTLGVAGTYTVTYTAADSSGNTASVTRTITILPSYTVYTNGNIIYFNPVSGLKCDLAAYTANTGASNNGTKIGCMKWYTFNDSSTSSTVNMILDHNTTAMVAWNSSGMNGAMNEVATALTSNTSTWNSALNARLITAPEIATIIGNATGVTTESNMYFASKTESQLSTCTSPTLTGCTYRWLYDRTGTDSATTYGALNNASGTTYGYWTSSTIDDYVDAWCVTRLGLLTFDIVDDELFGVRPVITVSKSVIS